MQRLTVLFILSALLMSGCMYSSNDELSVNSTLSSEEMRIMEEHNMYDKLIMRFMDANPDTLNQKQLTVAALITFEAEMMNGGLCQFFVNDYCGYAQYVGDALGEVGAYKMQAHYTSFLTQNGIDVTQMGSFRVGSIQDYLKQIERLPYEAFDNTFSEICENENLYDLLLSYVRLHEDEVLD